MKSKSIQEWLSERSVSWLEFQGILGTASPDCREAQIITDWAIHAVSLVESLEAERDHYRHLSKEELTAELETKGVDTEAFLKRCKGIIQEHKSFDQLAEQARNAINQMAGLYELSQNGTP